MFRRALPHFLSFVPVVVLAFLSFLPPVAGFFGRQEALYPILVMLLASSGVYVCSLVMWVRGERLDLSAALLLATISASLGAVPLKFLGVKALTYFWAVLPGAWLSAALSTLHPLVLPTAAGLSLVETGVFALNTYTEKYYNLFTGTFAFYYYSVLKFPQSSDFYVSRVPPLLFVLGVALWKLSSAKDRVAALVAVLFGLLLVVDGTAMGGLKPVSSYLDSTLSTEHFVLHYRSGTNVAKNSLRFAAEAEYYYAEDMKLLNAPPLKRRVHLLLFQDRESLEEFTGQHTVHFTQPWKPAVVGDTNGGKEMRTLKHELIHAIMSQYGGPLGAPLNPGIVEGIAVALATPVSLGPYAALNEKGELPPAKDYMTVAGFVKRKQSEAYWLSAGFATFLLKKYGVEKYKVLYRWGNFRLAYGKGLERLDEEYREFLSGVKFTKFDLQYGESRLGIGEKRAPSRFPPAKLKEEERVIRKMKRLFLAGDCEGVLREREKLDEVSEERKGEVYLYVGGCETVLGRTSEGARLLKESPYAEAHLFLLLAGAETPGEVKEGSGKSLTFRGWTKVRAAVCVAEKEKLSEKVVFALLSPGSDESFAVLAPFSRECREVALLVAERLKGKAKEDFLLSVLPPDHPYFPWAVASLVREYYYDSDFADAERLMKEHPRLPLPNDFKRRFEFVRKWVEKRKNRQK